MIDLTLSRSEFEKIISHLAEELSGIRTGRAHASFVEHIMVDSYGVPTPIKHIASLSIPDQRTILIAPWDVSLLKEIEKSITLASLGVQPVNDGASIRISLPQLTEENRRALVKIVGQKQEQAKISIRQVRDRIRDDIARAEKQNEVTEDDRYALQKELDDITKEYGARADALADDKEQEILTI